MWQQVTGGIFDSIFFSCSKPLLKYIECTELNEIQKSVDDDELNLLKRLILYSNNESSSCRALHIKSAKCIEKTINRDDWYEAMKCIKSKSSSPECSNHIAKSKNNRYGFVNSHLSPQSMAFFKQMEEARSSCNRLRIKTIDCYNREGESPDCIEAELEHKTCIWGRFIGEKKPQEYLECWKNDGDCKGLLDEIYTNLNEKASIAIDTDKRRTAQRTFEIYRNAVHPILLAGSYKKN